MARVRLSHVFFFVFFLNAAFHTTIAKGRLPAGHAALFIFGDSYLDTGNNNYIDTSKFQRADFWPYGGTNFESPTGRFSDGRVAGDFIAEYANLPPIPPFLQPEIEYFNGVNFASGGSGALEETYKEDNVIPLGTQLENYRKVTHWLRQKLGNDEAVRTIQNAVHLFSIGINDYTMPAAVNTTLNSHLDSEYVQMVIGNLTHHITEIYGLGGRKFAFMNVPPLGCLPVIRILKSDNNGSCLEEMSSMATMHNKALSNVLFDLEKKLEGFKYTIFDLYRAIEDRVNHPAKYGFKEGKSACCGGGEYRGIYSCGGIGGYEKFELCENPDDHIFWDGYHLTQRAHNQFADEMWNGGADDHSPDGAIIGPYTLKQLFEVIDLEPDHAHAAQGHHHLQQSILLPGQCSSSQLYA